MTAAYPVGRPSRGGLVGSGGNGGKTSRVRERAWLVGVEMSATLLIITYIVSARMQLSL